MINVLTRVTTQGSHPEILKVASAEDSATFMENIYSDIKEAYKEKAVTVEQIESLTDLLVELTNRAKEADGES